jgi:hypothetical protein
MTDQERLPPVLPPDARVASTSRFSRTLPGCAQQQQIAIASGPWARQSSSGAWAKWRSRHQVGGIVAGRQVKLSSPTPAMTRTRRSGWCGDPARWGHRAWRSFTLAVTGVCRAGAAARRLLV